MGVVAGVSHQSLLAHPDLTVTIDPRMKSRDRNMYVVSHLGPGERILQVNNPDIRTLACALLERMYYCKVDNVYVEPPNPPSATVRKLLKPFWMKLCRGWRRRFHPISPSQFVEMYDGRKRVNYERAALEYEMLGVSRKHARSVSFVKCEKVNPLKAPRGIQPRNPVYNVALGVYIKPIEHVIYRKIQWLFGSTTPIVFKGLNVVEMGEAMKEKWSMFDRPVGIGCDATKFDMHVSEAMLLWEHSIYQWMFPPSKELNKLLKWQRHNEGRGYCYDGKLKYSVKGRRFSGDMNTALGNCIIMCGIIYSYAWSKSIHLELANNGDDCMIILEYHDLRRFTEGFSEFCYSLGFRMVVEDPVYSLEKIEFCQMHPIQTPDETRMVRSPWVAREKDSISINDIRSITAYRKWMWAVGEGGMALSTGIPVFQNMYSSMARIGTVSNIGSSLQMECGARFLRAGLMSKYLPIAPTTRVSFYEAYGITPDEQEALEEYYDRLNLDHPRVEVTDLFRINTSPF